MHNMPAVKSFVQCMAEKRQQVAVTAWFKGFCWATMPRISPSGHLDSDV